MKRAFPRNSYIMKEIKKQKVISNCLTTVILTTQHVDLTLIIAYVRIFMILSFRTILSRVNQE